MSLTPIYQLARLQAANGHEECVDALLLKGADPLFRDVRGRTPLHMASMCGQVGVVGSLLQVLQGDLPLDVSAYSPIHWACYNGEC